MDINEIKEVLKTANNAYRDGNPIMSDMEYDALENSLREINPNDDWFKRGVNDEKPKSREYVLPYPMMSLDKVKKVDDIIAWAKKFPVGTTFIVTPKYDGLSVGMENEVAWTRGDGSVGQNCSEHVSSIYLKPENIDYIIRGEIIIDNNDWKTFKKINENAKSQRNSATGLINGDYDISRKKEYGLLRVMPYEIMDVVMDKDEQLKELGNQNFVKITNPIRFTEEYLLQLFISWKKLFPIDGLVIDVNEMEYRKGVEANGNPSYSIAYKHSSFSEVGYGVIDRIERNVNRQGVITPVVWLKEPINLSGADIQRVSAINMRYVYEWGLFPGEVVTIIRSGEVIPKIIGVGDSMIPFREEFNNIRDYENAYNAAVKERSEVLGDYIIDEYLELCPICGSKLVKDIDSTTGMWHEMVCKNPRCEGVQYASISKFFDICGVDGFGEKTFEQLMDCGLIEHSFFDAFNIRYEDLLELEGWGDLNSKKFIVEMNRIKSELPFARFLHATGWFSDLGEKTLQKLIDNHLFPSRMDGSVRVDGLFERLLDVDGVQEITAKKYIDGLELFNENLDKIQYNTFNFVYISTPVNEGPLQDMVICATGFRDRELFTKIEELGGVVGDGVTKTTTCLIVKDLSSTSSKVKKAEKMGIEILDINGFKEKYDIE